MTDAASSSALWPAYFTEEAIIWQATGVLMNRFDLDAEQGLELLRTMSESTGTRMRVIAERIVDRSV
jgi:AmiR/NasT family two-component response regulator